MSSHRLNPILHSLPVSAALRSFSTIALLWTLTGLQAALQAEEPLAAVTEADPAGIEFFEKHIRPLLVTHCYDCHSADEINGGLGVDSRAALIRGGDSGPSIVPGHPEKSLFLEAIKYSNQDLQMPPQNKLSEAEIAAVEKWIQMGAPDPREQTNESAGPQPTGMSITEGKEFWSFQPLSNPTPPEPKTQGWAKTPIDQFLLTAMEDNQLSPAAPADKRTLIRRATYDLIGLPPTPQEIADFLADESPEAFDKVVERLLASPQYGVRWGRHWLDVARYADSNGLDENLAYGNAWRYRDYVIDSFNDDKPFNQFVVEQLSGDLQPNPTQEELTATGFLTLGAKVLAEPDREKLEMDTIDEQLDTLGKAFLGMTFGCVRCHDHKFDPVKQTDYYAMAAIFKSTRTFADSNTGAIKHWYEHSFATPEDQERIKELDKQIAEKKRAAAAFKNEATAKLRKQTRALATDYLIAATKFDPSMSLNDVKAIAEPAGLHPRILHHCRLHLSYHTDDPFFKKWHELAAQGDIAGIDEHYRTLFAQSEQAWALGQKQEPKLTKLAEEPLEQARLALNDNAGFLAIPAKPEFAFDEEMLTEYYRLLEEARLFESQAADLPAAMGVSEGETQVSIPLHIRGSHRNLGDPVTREFPEVMRISEIRPIFPKNQSGRAELARWIASSQHPLTARVYVNRLWRWHFGQGLVNTPDNFGVLGDKPSHPELLDWLARHFIENGWSTKQMHRLIMSSQAYQMASLHPQDEAYTLIDAENRKLWKFPLQRLEAEQLRDAILFVSGQLDQTLEGKSVPLRNRQFVFDHTSIDHTKYESLRRAVYLPVIRNNLYTLFEQFDFPDPTMPTGHRHATVVAPQALLLMNADLVIDSARHLAEQLLAKNEIDESARLQLAYETTYGRPAEQPEIDRALAYLSEWTSASLAQPAGETDSPVNETTARLQAWSLLCQSLFASNEFIYVR